MKRILLSLLVSLLFTALGLLWISFRIDVGSGLSSLSKVPWWSIVLALGCLLSSYVVAAWRLQTLSRAISRGSDWFSCLRAHILGIFASVITPGGSGGHPVVALILAKDMPAYQASAVVLSLLKHDILFFSWSLSVAITVLMVNQHLDFNTLTLAATLLVLIGGIGLSLILSYRLGWLEYMMQLLLRGRLLGVRKRGLRFVQNLRLANDLFSQKSWSWHLAIQLSTGFTWLAFFSVLYPLALGFNVTLDWLTLVSYQVAIGLIATFVPTPGGSGFVEIALAELLPSKGQALLGLIILWRLVSHYSYFVLGPLLAGSLLGQLGQESEALS